MSGTSKLSNLERTAGFFEGIHIPFPYMNAFMAGMTESCCGLLLLIGLGVRLSNIPLIVTMIVAYLTAHRDEVSDLYTFVTAPPFLHMFACILTLVFGPGYFSMDSLFGSLFESKKAAAPSNTLQPQWEAAN
jgi:putative oxidoreductase